jgi:hypothetical protein
MAELVCKGPAQPGEVVAARLMRSQREPRALRGESSLKELQRTILLDSYGSSAKIHWSSDRGANDGVAELVVGRIAQSRLP